VGSPGPPFYHVSTTHPPPIFGPVAAHLASDPHDLRIFRTRPPWPINIPSAAVHLSQRITSAIRQLPADVSTVRGSVAGVQIQSGAGARHGSLFHACTRSLSECLDLDGGLSSPPLQSFACSLPGFASCGADPMVGRQPSCADMLSEIVQRTKPVNYITEFHHNSGRKYETTSSAPDGFSGQPGSTQLMTAARNQRRPAMVLI